VLAWHDIVITGFDGDPGNISQYRAASGGARDKAMIGIQSGYFRKCWWRTNDFEPGMVSPSILNKREDG
jgi:hypothetical protein